MRRFDTSVLLECWFLAGPTAVGKTAASLELADRLGGEIVSLDSMTLYRGMDIGTAKPDAETRARVPHHLLDLLDPAEEFSLAQYLEAAERVCLEILRRGRVPLFVGGTGLYLRTMLRGLFEGPPANWEIRQRYQQMAQEQGEAAVHGCLAKIDLPLSKKLHPRDLRRVIRGLEVFELTGQPLSFLQQQEPLPPEERPQNIFWLHPPRDWLYARIDARVVEMFAAGLVEEARQLLAAPRPIGRTARQALGYKEVFDHLEQGIPLEETIRLIQTRTRQFAKRQHTWFRNLEECHAIEISGGETASEVVQKILESARGSGR